MTNFQVQSIVLIAVLILSCRAGFGAETCWHIVQNTGGSGKHDVYLTEKAIRINSLSSGIFTIAKAPDWRIDRYNQHRKLQFSCEFKAWMMRDMSGFLNEFFGKWQTWKRITSSKLICGQPVTIYEWKSKHKKPPKKAPSSRTLIALYEAVEDNKSHSFYVWNRPQFQRQAQILATLYAMPDPPGVVLRNDVTVFSDPARRHILLTGEIKQIDQPKGIFDKPDGFKLTDKYAEFLLKPQDEVFMQLFGQ